MVAADARTFDWTRVQWGGPRARVSTRCSYCRARLPEDAVPLRLFTVEGFAATFCGDCEGAAFMALHLLHAEADGQA